MKVELLDTYVDSEQLKPMVKLEVDISPEDIQDLRTQVGSKETAEVFGREFLSQLWSKEIIE